MVSYCKVFLLKMYWNYWKWQPVRPEGGSRETFFFQLREGPGNRVSPCREMAVPRLLFVKMGTQSHNVGSIFFRCCETKLRYYLFPSILICLWEFVRISRDRFTDVSSVKPCEGRFIVYLVVSCDKYLYSNPGQWKELLSKLIDCKNTLYIL